MKVFITGPGLRPESIRQLSCEGRPYYVNVDCVLADATKAALKSLGAEDITEEIFRGPEVFRAEYAHAMRALNRENQSLEWWAMNFTNKNPLLTGLYNNVFFTASLYKLAGRTDPACLFVFTSNNIIAAKLKNLFKAGAVNVKCLSGPVISPKKALAQIFPFMIFYSAARAAMRKIVSAGPVKKSAGQAGLYIIATHLEDKCFSRAGFEDAYFKSLGAFLTGKGKDVLTVGYASCKLKNLLRSRNNAVFAFEKFAGFSDILRCGFKSLRIFASGFKIRGRFMVCGIDFTDFIRYEARLSAASGEFLLNLVVYRAVVNMLSRYKPARVLYPFENRSWEKMIISAVRDSRKPLAITGYQHASLTSKHVNFYLEEGEYAEIPFPDDIITMGHITRDIMKDTMNFPGDRLKVGCALRQRLSAGRNAPLGEARRSKRILVALASNINEYVKMLEFLDTAFEGGQPWQLVIRPHPIIDFEKALKLYMPVNIKYEIDSGSLYESLAKSDLVIYASSTVSLEAASMGIPVVCAAFDDVASPDPLFNIPALKWLCKAPQDLKKTISGIFEIDKTALSGMQQKARQYSRQYCVEADERAMEVFI